MNGLAVMNLAHAIAVVAHEGQSRKGAGEPYINHVERVADSVYGWKLKSIAYLHDVLEDTDIEWDDLCRIGIPMEIVNPVIFLTRQDDITYDDFISQMIAEENPMIIKVKIADIEDNLSDLDATEFWGLRKRYMAALLRLQEAIGDS